jgi:hypothetical protein
MASDAMIRDEILSKYLPKEMAFEIQGRFFSLRQRSSKQANIEAGFLPLANCSRLRVHAQAPRTTFSTFMREVNLHVQLKHGRRP